ncbi:Uma2 family endonuclease [Brunnivagina elsteri]|uniref:Putative restriction endonuclease domain-containing protein n=1 Tax=Brunnivagina elsteri CCALA 953 TaxID=987040 RepID=A0A2A2TJX7_9CYAN|nr:Uma2 family endonuclease [Calothrix elsteri]PAX55885.1 hypothetical protein CK510_10755 [Calothrix elsteri CCALA 953]
MQITEKQYYTPEEYLAFEEKADIKSEYINGEIIPMAGGSVNHNQIALNLSTELNFAFKKQDYCIYISDVRLWIESKCIYTYPDVMVIVGDAEFLNNRSDTVINPKVIIEVLSESTQGYDREGKFKAYRTISTFEEYLLIEQTSVNIEHYSKTANKRWSLQEYDEEDNNIIFTSIPFEIAILDLYNKVKFK